MKGANQWQPQEEIWRKIKSVFNKMQRLSKNPVMLWIRFIFWILALFVPVGWCVQQPGKIYGGKQISLWCVQATPAEFGEWMKTMIPVVSIGGTLGMSVAPMIGVYLGYCWAAAQITAFLYTPAGLLACIGGAFGLFTGGASCLVSAPFAAPFASMFVSMSRSYYTWVFESGAPGWADFATTQIRSISSSQSDRVPLFVASANGGTEWLRFERASVVVITMVVVNIFASILVLYPKIKTICNAHPMVALIRPILTLGALLNYKVKATKAITYVHMGVMFWLVLFMAMSTVVAHAQAPIKSLADKYFGSRW